MNTKLQSFLDVFKLVLKYLFYHGQIDFVRGANCVDKAQPSKTPEGLKDIPVVLSIVTLGTDTRLPCHYCSEKTGISGRVWQRRDLHGQREMVKLDLHDDMKKNRVFVAEDHSLVIREVSEEDGAYYFCYDVDNPGQAMMDLLLDIDYRSPLEPNVLNNPEDLSEEIRKVLKSCDGLKSVAAVSAYHCYMEWGPWGKCDKCGEVGERKRIGQCRLQKLSKVEMKSPEGKKFEADFPIIGVGCHSVILKTVPAAKEILDDIPNTVLIEKCEVSCQNHMTKPSKIKQIKMKALKKSSYLQKVKMKVLKKMKGVSQQMKSEVKSEEENAEITIFCPGTTMDTRVSWKFKEKEMRVDKLKEWTAGRVFIDATDAIHIKTLRISDAGEYICILEEVEIGLVRLKVISKFQAFNPRNSFGILTIGMVFSFILWSIMMSLKLKIFRLQKKAQQRGKASDDFTDETESSSLIESDINTDSMESL